VALFQNQRKKRHWRAEDTILSPWRDLPGTHTGAEIREMLNKGRFLDAMPADETPPKDAVPDD
jgi:hypothetical protein